MSSINSRCSCVTVLFPFAGRRLLAKFPVPVGFIRHHFVAQDIEHLVEFGPGLIGTLNGKTFGP